MTTLEAIYQRTSVRAFTTQVPPHGTIEALLEAAVRAPTAQYEQPWVFAVVQDRDLLRRLSDRAKALWVREAVVPRELHLRARPHEHGGFIALVQSPSFDVFHGATTLIAVGARRLDASVIGDCWLASQNLMLAAVELGLGTCCIGSAVPALNLEASKADAGIPADVTVVSAVVVGVPSGIVEPTARRRPEVVSWKR